MNTKKQLLNGPYLLGLTASHVTLAWEAADEGDFSVVYGRGQAKQEKIIPSYQRELPCREYPNGCCLYTADLSALDAGTVYEYAVCEGSNLLVSDRFETLPEHPETVRMVTISDSHLFHTEKQFARMVDRVKPDLILHGGDISFGTGYQREQYEANWFQKIPNVLRKTGVYYVPGNHDDGPFFQSFFTQPQAKVVHGMENGAAFSFEYGKAHIVMADSNPWGLFEMNAVNSGLTADKETKQRIEQTLQWIEKDLQSAAAKQASWRIVIVHHPYTDIFNNKYLVPIAERCGVDLLIGGHLHYYIKATSIDCHKGAKMMCVCQGSTQEPEASLEKIQEDKRLLSDFPEVVAIGHSNYSLLEVTKDTLEYKTYGFSEDGEDTLVDTIHMNHDEPKLSVDEVLLRRLDNNGNIEVNCRVKNIGTCPATAVLQLQDNRTLHEISLFGTEENNHLVLLEAGEEAKVTAFYKAASQGEHDITVHGEMLHITVFEPEQLTFAHMKIFPGKGEASDSLIASIVATNNLDKEIFVTVPLYIDQRVAESKNLFFRGHEKKSIEFQYKFKQGGSYQVSIADQLPKEIQIEGGIRIVPRIHDKSGNGHYALLRGTPKVIVSKERAEVHFEHYGDYIEIPASTDFNVDKGFTSMVWANVDRLAKPNEMGHNPLMVRGKSVGWGATYFLRMVIERAGGLKWGTCHDITEYSWQGGHAHIGSWTHYSMAFDKTRGGDSWCDGENVAHVSGIAPECTFRQWDSEPIFVGYSYIGHIIPEIDRPKYFTHLPGSVSQVRFYKTGLTDKENAQIYAEPNKKGPKCSALAAWYDFRDILTVGTHTTEWRHPTVFAPKFLTEKKYWEFRQMKVKTVLPLQAGLKATVEVSDDGATVKDSLKFVLKDGTNYIDLTPLAPAQYVRIVTEFAAEVNAEGTYIPELKEYQITACNETDFTEIFWSTRNDWEKGTFTGAVGFAPVDRLREYPEYTDVIHG